jgi:hypothetical protein
MEAKKEDFNELLIESINESLNQIGGTVRESIYRYLKAQFNTSPTEIPQKLKVFQEALEQIFNTGSRYIEVLILRNLYAKIELPEVEGKEGELKFIDYVNSAKVRFESQIEANAE